MKIFEINSGNYGSTGNIMLNIAETARISGHNVKVAYRQSRSVTVNYVADEIQIGNSFYGLTHRIIGEYLSLDGFCSVISTLKLILLFNFFNVLSIKLVHLYIYINILTLIFNVLNVIIRLFFVFFYIILIKVTQNL